MISSAKSNMYEVNALSTLAVYGDFVQGGVNQAVLALSTRSLSDAARFALESSAKALGYGPQACAFAVTSLPDELTLGAKDLMSVTEGLDPLAVVVADEAAAGLFGRAYRAEVPLDAFCHVLGRPLVAFRDLEAMLGTAEDKQRAWALLKKLPKLG